MALITVPSFLRYSMETANLGYDFSDLELRSAFTRQRQVLRWPSADIWRGDFTVPNLQGLDAGQMRAFLLDLDGRVNHFHMPVPGYLKPENGYAGPVGLVQGGGQSGLSLQTDGWPANTLVLPAGAYFTVNHELKVTRSDIVTDASGEALIEFKQLMRSSPPDNTPLIIENPYVPMSLTSPDQARWALRAPRFHSFTLDVMEPRDISS